MRARYKLLKETETSEKRERRLESPRVANKRARETGTIEQSTDRLEKCRKIDAQKNGTKDNEDVLLVEPPAVIKKEPFEFDPEASTSAEFVIQNNEDVVSVVSPVTIKEEPVEFVPEPFPSEDKGIKNVKKDQGDAVSVQPVVFIKQEPIEFDLQSSADVVIKDEFVVCSEDYIGSSTDAPPSTQPTSHVTLSVAGLGSSQKFDNGQ
ncbi:hypothetical protein CDAR_470601 [Caerostris darwini]|uniref:Uncharacterized protein n=1 Tax=Caerostris darwini TaxID=1538125 RepID=A0AAV4VGD6_9ARAC|nr:hypothetical protein CDAR_470601 [Caerostris darwini]